MRSKAEEGTQKPALIPWPSARVRAGPGPDAETEPEPVQGRRDGLSDYLEDDESHGIALFESETDKFLVSIVGRYDL
jgi:hypothetical protein